MEWLSEKREVERDILCIVVHNNSVCVRKMHTGDMIHSRDSISPNALSVTTCLVVCVFITCT